MGTRSRIGLQTGNGAVYSIYCHWDGYPSHNGRILMEHYATEERVRALLELGNLSVLDARLDPDPGHEHSVDGQRQRGVCLAYGRDRGETEQEVDVDDTQADFFKRCTEGWEEWAYLFIPESGQWIVSEVGGGCGPFLGRPNVPPGWALLYDVLQGEED